MIREPIQATGVQGFLQWVKARQPYLYRRIEKQLPKAGLAGLADTPLATVAVDASLVSTTGLPTSSSSPAIGDILKNLLMGAGQVVLTKQQLDAQKKILNLQLERARAGLPPADIDPTQYGLPGPNVKLGIDSDAKRVLMIGGGLLGGAFLLWLVLGSRGRRA